MQKIIISDLKDFDINHILLCGQIFRFQKLADNEYIVYSADKKCHVTQDEKSAIIECDDVPYFTNYFDLEQNYSLIKQRLKELPLMDDAIKNGNGIRILNQDKWETLVSFIISANNHIPRIKGIIERLCTALGDKKDDYFAFPSPQQMAQMDEEFYISIGAGYRAKYLASTSKAVAEGFDLNAIDALPSLAASKRLCELLGVGPKVADCILLFAYHKQDVFPVDTWIRKVYFDVILGLDEKKQNDNCILKNEVASPIIRKKLVEIYGQYSGYAQQYLFFNKRGI